MASAISAVDSRGANGGKAIEDLLVALEDIAASVTDRAEVMLALLTSGGDEASAEVVCVLEHGVELLDALCTATPRKERKAIKALSEQLESVIDAVDEHGIDGASLASCDPADVSALCAALGRVSGMDVKEVEE